MPFIEKLKLLHDTNIPTHRMLIIGSEPCPTLYLPYSHDLDEERFPRSNLFNG